MVVDCRAPSKLPGPNIGYRDAHLIILSLVSYISNKIFPEIW